jgi:hypothetical protein
MMKINIKNRFTGKLQFTAEIECGEDDPVSVKIGLAVYLARADIAGNLAGADLADALKIPDEEIPVIPKIDAVILAEIEKGGVLDMGAWHGPGGWCGTTHCRGGWAVHCAGKLGRELEQKVGTQMAATLIYHKSRPDKPFPWFFAPTDKALADIRECAAAQNEEATPR